MHMLLKVNIPNEEKQTSSVLSFIHPSFKNL